MNVIILLIVFSLVVAVIFLGAFIWAVRSGQYDDTDSPSVRILMDSTKKRKPAKPDRDEAQKPKRHTP